MRNEKNLKEAELFTLKVEAIKLAPNFPNAHSNLGLILMQKEILKKQNYHSAKQLKINLI